MNLFRDWLVDEYACKTELFAGTSSKMQVVHVK